MNHKISIITVVFNGKDFLEKTINSVISQTYRNIEYVIIDGESSDGTLDIIKEYEKYVSTWVSEPDNGIYDAMNKGLRESTGDYVWFLNAGDEVYSSTTLEEIFGSREAKDTGADAYYGNVEYVDNDGKSLGLRTLKTPPESLSWQSLVRGMVVSHQSIILKHRCAVIYNTDYKYCADIDWMVRSLKNCDVIVNTRKILSKFLVGGFSKNNIIKSNIERYKILRNHFSFPKIIKSHFILSIEFIKYFFSNKRKLY